MINEEENIEAGSQKGKTQSHEEVNGESLSRQMRESSENDEPQISKEPASNKNMELHHPHHVTHKKEWHEYLLEFIMLFLAVFLGFVAENIRETSVEHGREKEYARALYDEFYADSITYTHKVNARLGKERDCDYLYSYIKDSSLT
ncbi:MAG TPA: hypothetical protein VIJ75_11565, partial [Hanamia sp.]